VKPARGPDPRVTRTAGAKAVVSGLFFNN